MSSRAMKKDGSSSRIAAVADKDIDSSLLARMVQGSQVKVLDACGGQVGLGTKLGCESLENGLNPNFNFVAQREKFGKNFIDMEPMPTYLSMIWEGLHDTTMLMLIAAAIASLVLGLAFENQDGTGWIEGTSIFASVFIVLNVQATMEYTKTLSFRRQQKKLEDGKSVNLIRGGKITSIHPREIVVGDVLRIQIGDIVAADGLLIDGFGIKMDEAALTGESKLMQKVPRLTVGGGGGKEDEASPFILSGTNVMDGSGKLLVLAVGLNSVQGKILAIVNGGAAAKALAKKEKEKTAEPAAADNGISIVIKPVAGGGGVAETKAPEIHAEDMKNASKNEAGGTLMDKLDKLAIDIGKVGLTLSSLVFIVLVVRWGVQEFAEHAHCKPYDKNITKCEALKKVGCIYRNNADRCERIWVDYDGGHLLEYFLTAVTILVVAVPEGLPLAVTLSLAVSMRKMARDNNQVKHMDSCETMGSATTICSDKTGTLTENRMTIMRVGFTKEVDFVHDMDNNIGVGAVVAKSNLISPELVKLMASAISLNTIATSNVKETSPGVWKYEGNPTECALLKLVVQFGVNPTQLREQAKMPGSKLDWGVHCFPFSSSRKRMSWVVKSPNGSFRLFTKGAPTAIIQACSSSLNPKTMQPMPMDAALYNSLYASYEDQAMRVIAIAYKDFAQEPEGGWAANERIEMSDCCLIGVVGIEDPLRPTIIQAVKQCNSAGIDVRMCTGDSLATAVSISKKCFILRDKDLDAQGKPKPFFAMTGAEFDERVHYLDKSKPKILRRSFDFRANEQKEMMAYQFVVDDTGLNKVINQQAFDKIWPRLRVLARCQPEDKLTLVKGMRQSRVFMDQKRCDKLLEEDGIDIFPDYQVVAVTGDGTNDAPALKSADVGFAMGIVGTEIAKQACDIVLLDDNFASIIKAVKWGRNVFDAISKFIQFQLTVNVCAITVSVVGSLIYNQSPLGPVQMLWVNLIMDSLASLALATEPPVDYLLERKPYGKERPMISRVMVINILGQALYQFVIIFVILTNPQIFPSRDGENRVAAYPPPIRLDNVKVSEHWTIVFNTFVLLQLANQLNSRKLPTVERLRTIPMEWNVFTGLLSNPTFIIIWMMEIGGQILIVTYAKEAVSCDDYLTLPQWGLCIAFACGCFAWQIVIFAFIALTGPCFARMDERGLKVKLAKRAAALKKLYGSKADRGSFADRASFAKRMSLTGEPDVGPASDSAAALGAAGSSSSSSSSSKQLTVSIQSSAPAAESAEPEIQKKISIRRSPLEKQQSDRPQVEEYSSKVNLSGKGPKHSWNVVRHLLVATSIIRKSSVGDDSDMPPYSNLVDEGGNVAPPSPTVQSVIDLARNTGGRRSVVESLVSGTTGEPLSYPQSRRASLIKQQQAAMIGNMLISGEITHDEVSELVGQPATDTQEIGAGGGGDAGGQGEEQQ